MVKFHKNTKTNEVIMVLKDEPLDENEIEMKANSTDAATEKHVPVVTIEGNKVHVEVGSTIHPMTDAHYITFIALVTNNRAVLKKLKPTDEPKADFHLEEFEKVTAVYENCNLHGLWVKKIEE